MRKSFILLTAALCLGTVARAQSVGDGPPPMPSPAEVSGLIDAGLVILGGLLVRPVTAIFQTWKVTCKVDAKIIAAVLALIFVGVQGYLNGTYGHGWAAFGYALAASLLAFIRSYGANRAMTLAAEGGQRKALLAPANDVGDVNTTKGLIPASVDAGTGGQAR